MKKNTISNLPVPKYYKLKYALLEYIEESFQKAGVDAEIKLPSESALIKKYKYSQITVRRALNELENDGVIYKVNGRGTFAKVAGSRTTAEPTGTLGFYSYRNPELDVPANWHTDFLQHLRWAVDERGYNLLNISVRTFREGPLFKKFLQRKQVDGLILLNPEGGGYMDAVSKAYPCVYLGAAPGDEEDAVVTVDHAAGAELVMNCLIKNGHRDIVMIHGIEGSNPAERIRKETGLALLERNGCAVEGDRLRSAKPTEEDGYRVMSGLLAERTAGTADFTAVYVTEYLAAIGVARAVKEFGLSVPDDISVVCCNGSSYLDVFEPRLTHAREPLADWTRVLVDRLVSMAKGSITDEHREVLKPELIKGTSVKKLSKLVHK